MFDLSPAEWTAIELSLRVATVATLVATPLGIALAWLLARREFWGKAALEKLGAWQAAEPKFAMAENVRAALTLVARGEAVLGIVYSTDAKVEPGVKIVGTFPADSHPPIIYPVAATATAKPEAASYLDFLRSSAAKATLEKYGFTYLIRPTS